MACCMDMYVLLRSAPCCASLIQLSKHEWLWRAFMKHLARFNKATLAVSDRQGKGRSGLWSHREASAPRVARRRACGIRLVVVSLSL